jgi:hypothetical protein
MPSRGDEPPAVCHDLASHPSGVAAQVDGVPTQVAYAESAGLSEMTGEALCAP